MRRDISSSGPSPFKECGVTPEELELSAQKDLDRIGQARKTGTLKPWNP